MKILNIMDGLAAEFKRRSGAPLILIDNEKRFEDLSGVTKDELKKILTADMRWLWAVKADALSIKKDTTQWRVHYQQGTLFDYEKHENNFTIDFRQGERTVHYANLYPMLKYRGDGATPFRNVLRAAQRMNLESVNLTAENQQAAAFFTKAAAMPDGDHLRRPTDDRCMDVRWRMNSVMAKYGHLLLPDAYETIREKIARITVEGLEEEPTLLQSIAAERSAIGDHTIGTLLAGACYGGLVFNLNDSRQMDAAFQYLDGQVAKSVARISRDGYIPMGPTTPGR